MVVREGVITLDPVFVTDKLSVMREEAVNFVAVFVEDPLFSLSVKNSQLVCMFPCPSDVIPTPSLRITSP